MVSTIDHIRNILSENRPEEALVELQGWMAPGDETLMKSLISMKRRQGSRSLSGDLGKLLDQIERESPRLTSFLGHYHAANTAFKEKQWLEARVHLEQAIELHQSEYLALKPDLLSKLDRLEHQESMERLIGEANARYEEGQWKDALEMFRQARSHYFPGCEWNMDSFEEVIQRCKNGVAYEQHIAEATTYQKQGKWTQAISELHLARQNYHQDFTPGLSDLEEEIRWTNEQASMDNREVILDSPVIVMMRKYLLPVLFSLTIGALAWLFLQYPEWASNAEVIPATFSSDEAAADLQENVNTNPEPPSSPVSTADEAAEFEPVESQVSVEEVMVEEFPQVIDGVDALPIPPVPQSIISGQLVVGEEIEIRIANFEPEFQYEIDFGDGSRTNGNGKVTHVYEEAGTYQLSIKAANQGGGGNAVSRTVTIDAARPEPEVVELNPISNPAPVPEPPVTEPSDRAVELPVTRPVTPRDFADVMPSFPGGSSALRSYLERETRYPEQARENELQGKVYIQFVVGSDGSLTDIRLARGIGFGCDEEALRLVKSMPEWIPGSHQGTVQPVRYTLPITFVLK